MRRLPSRGCQFLEWLGSRAGDRSSPYGHNSNPKEQRRSRDGITPATGRCSAACSSGVMGRRIVEVEDGGRRWISWCSLREPPPSLPLVGGGTDRGYTTMVPHTLCAPPPHQGEAGWGFVVQNDPPCGCRTISRWIPACVGMTSGVGRGWGFGRIGGSAESYLFSAAG